MNLIANDWRGIIQTHGLVGRDMEIQSGPILYRGPIRDVIILDGGVCRIIVEWWARFLYYGDPVWEYCPNLNPELDVDYPPLIHADGRIEFVNDSKDVGTIYPRNKTTLKPRNVFGLPAQYLTQEPLEEPTTTIKFHEIEFSIASELLRQLPESYPGVKLIKDLQRRIDNHGDPLKDGYCMVDIYGESRRILSLLVVAGNLREEVEEEIKDLKERYSSFWFRFLKLFKFWKRGEKDLLKFLA